MAKTGRRGKQDDREPKTARIAAAVTETQKKKLAWLSIQLKLSIADLIGQWIEMSFENAGGLISGDSVIDQPSIDNRLLAFIVRCDRGETIPDFEVVDLAHALDVDEDLLLRLRTCLTEQWKVGNA